MNKKTSVDTPTLFNPSLAPVYVRHPFERVRTPTPIVGESMTHQSHADTCDINKIIKRFENTGQLPPAQSEAQYADVTALQGDLTERINMSRETLDEAGRNMEAQQQAAEQAEKQKQMDMEEKIKQLEAQEKANKQE